MFLLATYTLSIPQLGAVEVGEALEWVFIVFLPNYDLGLALMDMYSNAGNIDYCEQNNYKNVCPVLAQMNLKSACCGPGRYSVYYIYLTFFHLS